MQVINLRRLNISLCQTVKKYYLIENLNKSTDYSKSSLHCETNEVENRLLMPNFLSGGNTFFFGGRNHYLCSYIGLI